jgi:hypothetical protein
MSQRVDRTGAGLVGCFIAGVVVGSAGVMRAGENVSHRANEALTAAKRRLKRQGRNGETAIQAGMDVFQGEGGANS